MAPNPRIIDERLQAIYDQLPSIECQGLCSDSCGPIPLSLRERVRMERAAGHPLGVNGITCNMLVNGRCSVYEQRPLICRLWGVVESLPCHYGCKPQGGYLPDEEGARLVMEAIKVGGPLNQSDAELARRLEELKAEIGDESVADVLREGMREHVARPTLAGRSQRSLIDR